MSGRNEGGVETFHTGSMWFLILLVSIFAIVGVVVGDRIFVIDSGEQTLTGMPAKVEMDYWSRFVMIPTVDVRVVIVDSKCYEYQVDEKVACTHLDSDNLDDPLMVLAGEEFSSLVLDARHQVWFFPLEGKDVEVSVLRTESGWRYLWIDKIMAWGITGGLFAVVGMVIFLSIGEWQYKREQQSIERRGFSDPQV